MSDFNIDDFLKDKNAEELSKYLPGKIYTQEDGMNKKWYSEIQKCNETLWRGGYVTDNGDGYLFSQPGDNLKKLLENILKKLLEFKIISPEIFKHNEPL